MKIWFVKYYRNLSYLQLKVVKIDNNGIKPASPEWDKGTSANMYIDCRTGDKKFLA
jgi:hypothetical protein